MRSDTTSWLGEVISSSVAVRLKRRTDIAGRKSLRGYCIGTRARLERGWNILDLWCTIGRRSIHTCNEARPSVVAQPNRKKLALDDYGCGHHLSLTAHSSTK